jgi:hypothetical protein
MAPADPTGSSGPDFPPPADPGPRPPGNAPPPCWTTDRNQIKAWMQRNAPSLAELYEGAVMLLYINPLPGHVRFIAHAVREIRNRLPDAIAGPTKKQRLDYTSRIDAIVKLPGSRTLIADIGDTTAPRTTTITIDRKLAQKMAVLLQDHLTTRAKPLDAARRLFQTIAPENTTRETLTPVLEHWINTTEWFMRLTHDNKRTDNQCAAQELQHQFTMFESAIAAAIKPFFDTLEDLDAILEIANN